MFALIDGNSFFCSCERVFRPELKNTPIAVLSNNDGCVIARTSEVKAMGIKMGTPYFKVKHLVQQKKLIVFSSNYELYADLSSRMMQSIASLVPNIKVYSIDECFADVQGISNLRPLGLALKQRVLQWVGIPTCVGIAPTKTLAKFCNHLAKRHRNHFNGVVVWTDWSKAIQERALANEPVTEIWGVGRQLGAKLISQGINTALDLSNAHTPTLRQQFGVVLERLQRELQGTVCNELDLAKTQRKSIVRSRSFGHPVTGLDGLTSAISHHIASGASTLRQEGTQARTISVFIYTNRFRNDLPQYYGHKKITIDQASADTLVLNNIALDLLKSIYKANYEYKKCGIELSDIIPCDKFKESDLLLESNNERREKLMNCCDSLTSKYGKDRLILGSEFLSQDWKMTRNELSPCFTTRWTELPVIN